MKNKLLPVTVLVTSCFVFNGVGFAKHKKNQPPADTSTASSASFDYYLFVLSWAPEFCATNAKGGGTAECDPDKHMGLVVHGLWPQYNNGKWPEDCASTPPVASAMVNHMMPIMPGKQLIQHEWSKHGTCSGLTSNDYFAAIEKLYTGLKLPEDFKKPASSARTGPGDIEAKFASSNDASKNAFRVSCPQNEFSAVEVCLSKDLQYQECPMTLKECKASRIEVLPVP
jgi:ribonuclease T2